MITEYQERQLILVTEMVAWMLHAMLASAGFEVFILTL